MLDYLLFIGVGVAVFVIFAVAQKKGWLPANSCG